MKKYRNSILLINLVVIFGLLFRSIVHKENVLQNGQLILLKLAPKDPRSLMQGDYMALRYQIANDWRNDKENPKRGYCVVVLDENNIGSSVRFQFDKTKKDGEYLIPYTKGSRWRINIGAESFFFQEGEGEKFEKAKYGGLKVDDDGKSVLIGLYDEKLNKI